MWLLSLDKFLAFTNNGNAYKPSLTIIIPFRLYRSVKVGFFPDKCYSSTQIQCNLDLVTHLVFAKTVTKLHNVTINQMI